MKVSLNGILSTAADGASEIDLTAGTIRELLQKLEERYPRMAPHVKDGIAVAINGQIFRDSWNQPIPEDAEVYLLPRIAGG
ncbi:MAG: MoaD/ThiS family protein [Pseudomonadales bacterium]|nr:MoaD/ThiS family protein [Pseudomonadales bacterium]